MPAAPSRTASRWRSITDSSAPRRSGWSSYEGGRHHRPQRLRQVQCDKFLLREKGYPCIDADLVAREVLLPGSPCIAQLQQVFGADIADENGTVRRRLLADRAFATPEGTAALTDITQPEILRRIDAALTRPGGRGEPCLCGRCGHCRHAVWRRAATH